MGLIHRVVYYATGAAIIGCIAAGMLLVYRIESLKPEVETTYSSATIEELLLNPNQYNWSKIIVEGIPIEVRVDKYNFINTSPLFLTIGNSAGQRMNVCRGEWNEYSDFSEVYNAIRREISDGDSETVKVTGTFRKKGNTIYARFIEVEGDTFIV